MSTHVVTEQHQHDIMENIVFYYVLFSRASGSATGNGSGCTEETISDIGSGVNGEKLGAGYVYQNSSNAQNIKESNLCSY